MKSFVPLLAAIVMTVASSAASALGLGEAALYSQLGQKLRAEVPLINMGDLTQEELAVSITHPQGSWSPIKAQIIKRGDGKPVIGLHSTELMNEPYVEFTVIVRWPQGEVRRDMTLLLDTPGSH
jgi:pilus assembly protein FimV